MDYRIKELCKEKGLLFKDLAKKIGITDIGLRQSLQGNPTVGTLEKIASALDVEITELFEKRGDFIAFVSTGGDTRRFDRPDELSKYIETITKNQ